MPVVDFQAESVIQNRRKPMSSNWLVEAICCEEFVRALSEGMDRLANEIADRWIEAERLMKLSD